jgi:peptidoglycan L-alanyl-D-glutamate endopeptidase CwlK
MPKFSAKSDRLLAQCDPSLQVVFNYVVVICDCTIITGHRDEATQDEMLRQGKSQVSWPNSRHNSSPSRAVDAAPYPIDWKDRERATLFAGLVLGVADVLGIKLRWGGDWDGDWQVNDNNFDDLWHFEILD